MEKRYPFHIPTWKSCSHFYVMLNKETDAAMRGVYSKNYTNKRPFYLNDRFPYYGKEKKNKSNVDYSGTGEIPLI